MSKNQQNFYIPFLAKIHLGLRPYVSLILRVLAGSVFIAHGWGKFQGAFFGPGLEDLASYIETNGLPFPFALAWLSMITEMLGGICIILGLFTRLWAFMGAVMMYLIVLFIKDPTVFSARQGGIEYDLALAVIFTVIAIIGAGNYSIDAKMKKVF